MRATRITIKTTTALALAVLWVTVLLFGPTSAFAQARKIIRDAEIENTIREYAAPIFQAAGLSPSGVEIYLIDDPALNAFVSGGQRLFIHTGLLMRTEDPLEVMGVIAHETGHIAGGHIAGRINEAEQARTGILISYLLGLGAALATGQGEFALAAMRGGQDIVLKSILSYSRSQEQAADQSAVRLLEATGHSPAGLLRFMNTLQGQEALLSVNQDPYMRTHPLTIERLTFLERAVEESAHSDETVSPELARKHARMRAKLIGFLQPPQQVYRAYPKDETSLEARYAHAIVSYRSADLDRALPLIDELIAEHPDDPYFHELKGQMLFENGRLREGLPHLERAVELQPDAPQLRLLLARVQIELNSAEQDAAALENLRRVIHAEPENALAWRLAATAYGRQGDTGMTSLAMAEATLAQGKYAQAQVHAKRAIDALPTGSPSWVRADDVFNAAEREEARSR